MTERIGTATPDQTLTSQTIEWLSSDVPRSILLLTGIILIAIIGVSLTSWWSYSLEDLQDRGFISESNIYGVNTSGFSLSGLDAVKIALRECERMKIDHITVRPRNETLLENRTVLVRESWEVHLWHSSPQANHAHVTWAFLDPYSGQVLSLVNEKYLTRFRRYTESPRRFRDRA